MADARFEDGAEQPLRLKALDAEDLSVISTLLQDAVGQNSEISWMPKKRRFALLLNRFRWEDASAAERKGRPYERVQSMFYADSVLKVSSQGIDPKDKDLVFEVLSVAFVAGEDGAGRIEITLAGDGAIALEVECLDVSLNDMSRPYIARAKHAPHHPDE